MTAPAARGVTSELHVYPGAIHAFEMVPETGLAELVPGQELRARIAPGQKGPLAVVIEVPAA